MSRRPQSPTSSPSRIRFIMVDAEISNGDLGQVTQAIQNALRPQQAVGIKKYISTTTSPQDAGEPAEAELVDPGPDMDTEPVEDALRTADQSPRARAPRKIRTPKVLEIDLVTEPSLESYAKKVAPTSDRKRFLTIAAWFHLHRGGIPVTADHVYTCYRHLKWPSNIKDFSQPLRDLKRDQYLELKGKGEFSINHLGLSEIETNKE